MTHTEYKWFQFDRILFLGIRYFSYKVGFHSRVASFGPRLANPIFSVTVGLVRLLIWFLRHIFPDRYTDANPYKMINTDPANIQRSTGHIFSKRRGWVVGGTWDNSGHQYNERTFSRAIRQRFVEDKPWEDTDLADRYDDSKFRRRTEAIERLYHNISTEGYKSQRQLLEEEPEAAWSGLNDAMHPLANEVAVDIGRNGELLWNICGQHRLAIAKILEVDSIPVQVFRRHTEWQKIRDRVRAGEPVPEELLDHPDLQDLVDTE